MNRLRNLSLAALLGAASFITSAASAQAPPLWLSIPNSSVTPTNGLGAVVLDAPNNGASGTALERHLRFVVDDATDFLDIMNGTNLQNNYYPVIHGCRSSSTWDPAVTILGSCTTSQDGIYNVSPFNRYFALVAFDARTYSTSITSSNYTTVVPDGPTEGAAVLTRPLFDWTNFNNIEMRMDHNGNLGIGNIDPANNLVGAKLKVTSEASGIGLEVDDHSTTQLLSLRDAGFLDINAATTIAGTNTAPIALSVRPLGSIAIDANIAGVPTSTSSAVTGIQSMISTVNSGQIARGVASNIVSTSPGATAFGVNALVSSGLPGSSNYGVFGQTLSTGATISAGGYFTANDPAPGGPVYGVYADVSTVGCAPFACGIYTTSSPIACGGAGNVWAAYFNGDGFLANGPWTFSDMKLKTNIQSFDGALDKLAKLTPRTYTFKAGDYPSMNFPQGTQIGLVAQELETVFPSLVKETAQPPVMDSKGNVVHEAVDFKAVNYTGLIPVLVRGIQEQQDQIEALKQQIATLNATVSKLASTASVEQTQPHSTAAILYQNIPNPTNAATTIRYNLPANSVQSELVITDINGVEFKRLSVQGGDGQIELSAHSLAPGAYVYSLIVNGVRVDSKKLIVTP